MKREKLLICRIGVDSLLLTYEKRNEGFSAEWKKSIHVPPHIHEAIEIIYVTDGSVELGVGQELYHMGKGDFAIVFPNVVHHYQVFDAGKNKAIYLFLEPSLSTNYLDKLQNYSPEYPIIHKDKLHPDVPNAIKTLLNRKDCNAMLVQAYMQIILAYVFSEMKMVDKDEIGGDNLIYKAVEYVARNFNEEISLDKMAYDLCVSKYALSRLFAKTFHCNFNRYVNEVRLNHVVALLESKKDSIINIGLDAGFESQRTFNRVFKERFKMTPREYRNQIQAVKMQSV